jgi:hypothetical protein
MVLARLAFHGSDRLSKRASESRLGWLAMLAVPALMILVEPVAAQQVSCNSGPLAFLSSVKVLSVQGAGIIFFTMVVIGGGLKAIPAKGTNSWGNSLLRGFMAGVAFVILGPALINLADGATPIDLSAQCTTGGSSGN